MMSRNRFLVFSCFWLMRRARFGFRFAQLRLLLLWHFTHRLR